MPPKTPFTSHETVAPLVRQNDAVNDCVLPSETLAELGEIEFVAGQVIVTLALPDFVASATLVAVTVIVAGKGWIAGAM